MAKIFHYKFCCGYVCSFFCLFGCQSNSISFSYHPFLTWQKCNRSHIKFLDFSSKYNTIQSQTECSKNLHNLVFIYNFNNIVMYVNAKFLLKIINWREFVNFCQDNKKNKLYCTIQCNSYRCCIIFVAWSLHCLTADCHKNKVCVLLQLKHTNHTVARNNYSSVLYVYSHSMNLTMCSTNFCILILSSQVSYSSTIHW